MPLAGTRLCGQSLGLREAPISQGMGEGRGGAKTHMVVTLGDPLPIPQPPVGAVSPTLSTC